MPSISLSKHSPLRRHVMNNRLAFTCLALGLTLSGCGPSGSENKGGDMELLEASNGFGQVLPHRVNKVDPDTGAVTTQVVAIRSLQTMIDNVSSTNPIQATTVWRETATLPNGRNGNHFYYARFSAPIDFKSVFTSLASAQDNSNLLGSITVTTVDPVTGIVEDVQGRGFIGGRTVAGVDPNDPTLLLEQKWIGLDGTGKPIALLVDGAFPGLGFPGTEDPVGFGGAATLVGDDTFVFIPDADGDLSTLEMFESGRQINMRISNAVLSTSGASLSRPALASSTVGKDTLSPEVSRTPASSLAAVTPAMGEEDVDPRTNIVIEFTEPVQPFSVGPLPVGLTPPLSGAVAVQFGATTPVSVPFFAKPLSVYDLTRYEIDPSFDFPGQGPTTSTCGLFNRIDVTVSQSAVRDLDSDVNMNQNSVNTFFITGEGPGLVNAPVTPDVIFVGLAGSQPGISVIDLNGFGAGTGNPTFDPLVPIKRGNSNYPNNPNLQQASNLIPPLQSVGQCTFDGGSEGVFTLSRDSTLDTRLIKPPLISSVSDMMLGRALDTTFNNGPPPFGCQAGGGNVCASTQLKLVSPSGLTAPNTLAPNNPLFQTNIFAGLGNLASWAPHPNPPPLVFPPLCLSPLVGGQEPTSVDSSSGIDGFGNPILINNLLGPNPDFLGDPFFPNGPKPPAGLPTREQNSFFLGPSAPQLSIASCTPYQIRQQIGYFLYVVDRVRREVVVLNSNRFTVIDRIQLPDPTSLAMSPNLDFLAVSNQSAGTVSFININPSSANFHKAFKTTKVENGPRGLAWDPGNEDLLVCNEDSNSVSIISTFSLNVRKTVRNQLNSPFELAVTQRQTNFGFNRNVYFAFILNRDGSVALFESGPNGVNGWGFDEIIGRSTIPFANPKSIAVDNFFISGGCWIVHENPIDPASGMQIGSVGQAAVSNLVLESTTGGQQPLATGGTTSNPGLRDIEFAVRISIGPDQLTGIPVDIAFDNLMNVSGLPNTQSIFSAGSPVQANGKSQVKGTQNVNEATYIFLAVPFSNPILSGQGGGVVDVIDINDAYRRLDTDPFQTGTQSIAAQGVSVLMDYFRQ